MQSFMHTSNVEAMPNGPMFRVQKIINFGKKLLHVDTTQSFRQS